MHYSYHLIFVTRSDQYYVVLYNKEKKEIEIFQIIFVRLVHISRSHNNENHRQFLKKQFDVKIN